MDIAPFFTSSFEYFISTNLKLKKLKYSMNNIEGLRYEISESAGSVGLQKRKVQSFSNILDS